MLKSNHREQEENALFNGTAHILPETLMPLGGGVKPACSLRFELGSLGLGVCNSSSLMREVRWVPASVEKFSSLAVEKKLKCTLHSSRLTLHTIITHPILPSSRHNCPVKKEHKKARCSK